MKLNPEDLVVASFETGDDDLLAAAGTQSPVCPTPGTQCFVCPAPSSPEDGC
jgi:hypothetical protein